MNLSPRDFTRDKMKKMGHSGAVGSPPGNIDSNKDDAADDWGKKAAGASDSSSFKKGGEVTKGKRPHMGRAGRAIGGRVGRAEGGKIGSINTQMKDEDAPLRMGDLPKYQRGGRTHGDEQEDRALIDQMVKPSARARRARGGKTGKGKTVVNIVVAGGGKGDQQPAVQAPPMAAPMPPPPPPQRPPMPPPQGNMPPIMMPGGAPMGPAGAPPPGAPMMRAKGGRVAVSPEGHKVFSAKSRNPDEKAGAASGKGRLEKARRQA